MISFYKRTHNRLFQKTVSICIALSFFATLIVPPTSIYAQTLPTGGNFYSLNLPAPGTMVTPSAGYTPAIVQGLKVFPEDPLKFDFLIDNGDSALQGEEFEKVSIKLIRYFLASLTVPEGDLWVNLSPYEQGRIIPENFGQTEMGRDLLAQDYVLKQLTASLMYPEDELGQKFWERVYARASALYGTTEIPINTFNKVWIIPDKAVVYEAQDNTALLVESHLKVMLEEDYLSLNENINDKFRGTDRLATSDVKDVSKVSSDIIREILIPEIEKEVNEGQNFANLRQIYQSMILAIWYKKNLKESLLGQVYVNKSKLKGVDAEDQNDKEKIYQQYLEAFKKGVYDLVKDDYDPASESFIPRRYISGGATVNPAVVESVTDPRNFSPEAIRTYTDIRNHTGQARKPDGTDAGRAIKRTTVVLADLGSRADANNITDVLTQSLPSVRQDTGDAGAATDAQEIEFFNSGKIFGDVRSFVADTAIKRTINSRQFSEISSESMKDFSNFIESEETKRKLAKLDIRSDDLRELLENPENPVKVFFIRDIRDGSPAIVMENLDNYQMTHVGLDRHTLYVGSGISRVLTEIRDKGIRTVLPGLDETTKQEIERKDESFLLNVLLLRELVSLHTMKKHITDTIEEVKREGRDPASLEVSRGIYDFAVDLGQESADQVEKAFVEDKLDRIIRDHVFFDFSNHYKRRAHRGFRVRLSELAKKDDGFEISDASDRTIDEVNEEFLRKLITLEPVQYDQKAGEYAQLMADSNRDISNIYEDRPFLAEKLTQTRLKGYRNEYLSSIPAENLAGIVYVELYRRDRLDEARERLIDNETIKNLDEVSHEELFGEVNQAIDHVFEGLEINQFTEGALRAELTKRFLADILQAASKEGRAASRNVRVHFTDPRDYSQSSYQTGFRGAVNEDILRAVVDLGNDSQGIETGGGNVPLSYLLTGLFKDALEDPFYNSRQQMFVLRDKLREAVANRIDLDSDDGQLLYDRYEAKMDRRILSEEELHALLERNGVNPESDRGREISRVYGIKQEALFRGFYAIALNKLPAPFVRKVLRVMYKNGTDVFRIFTADNDIREIMQVMDFVRELPSARAQPVVHWTNNFAGGDERIVELARYLVEDAQKEGERDILDSLVIKDAPGIITPEASFSAFSKLREEFPDIPLQLHTHDTGAFGAINLFEAIRGAGRVSEDAEDGQERKDPDIVIDVSLGPEPFGQPRFRGIATMLQGTAWEGGLQFDDDRLKKAENEVSNAVNRAVNKNLNIAFDDQDLEIKAAVIKAGLPGGMFSNFVTKDVIPSLKGYRPLFKDFFDVQIIDDAKQFTPEGKRFQRAFLLAMLEEMVQVTEDFGFPSRVTPYSQWIGVQAVNNLVSWIRQGWMDYDKKTGRLVRNLKFADSLVARYFETTNGRRTLQVTTEMKNMLFVWAQDRFLQRLNPEVNRDLVYEVYLDVIKEQYDGDTDKARLRVMSLRDAIDRLEGIRDDEDFRTDNRIDDEIQKYLKPYYPMARAIRSGEINGVPLVDLRAVTYVKNYNAKYGRIDSDRGEEYERQNILGLQGDGFLSIALDEDEFDARFQRLLERMPDAQDIEEDSTLAYAYGARAETLFTQRGLWKTEFKDEPDPDDKERIVEILRRQGVSEENLPTLEGISDDGGDAGQATLLLVDDDQNVLDPISTLLRMRGFNVVTANSGEEATQLVENDPDRFLGVMTDFEMGAGLTGAQVAGRIRNVNPEIPVLIFSGTDPETIQSAISQEEGAADVVRRIIEKNARVVLELPEIVVNTIGDPKAGGDASTAATDPSAEDARTVIAKPLRKNVQTIIYPTGNVAFRLSPRSNSETLTLSQSAGTSPDALLEPVKWTFSEKDSRGENVELTGSNPGQNIGRGTFQSTEGNDYISRKQFTIEQVGPALIVTHTGTNDTELTYIRHRTYGFRWVAYFNDAIARGYIDEAAGILSNVAGREEPLSDREQIWLARTRQVLNAYQEKRSRISKGQTRLDSEPSSSGDAGTVPVGGIDLNPELLDLQIKRDPNGVPLPLPQQPIHDMKIEGFLPIIINITPVNSLPLLLGAEEGEDEVEQLGQLSVFDVRRHSFFSSFASSLASSFSFFFSSVASSLVSS